MNYTELTLSFQLEANREFQSILFEQMDRESDFILSCLESMVVTMEAVENGETKRNFFQKIIDFIKKLFGLFSEKAKTLIQSNKQWLDENADKLSKLNYDSLEIQMIPFWNRSSNDIIAEVNKILTKSTNSLKGNIDRFKDMKNVKEELFKEYLDENGELTGGLKNNFRVGASKGPIKTVQLKDTDLKNRVVGEFVKYCQTYGSTVVPAITKLSNDITRVLDGIDKNIKTKSPVKESFCLVEGDIYSNTELVYCENFIVLEAEQPAEDKKPDSSNTNDKKQSPTKVEVTDHGDKENAEKQDKLNSMSSTELTVAKNIAQVSHIAFSAALTVLEERNSAYMNAMKQILSARKNTLEKTADENKK